MPISALLSVSFATSAAASVTDAGVVGICFRSNGIQAMVYVPIVHVTSIADPLLTYKSYILHVYIGTLCKSTTDILR